MNTTTNFLQTDHLTPSLQQDLEQLLARCQKVDGVDTLIHWDILKTKREIPGNFFLYQQNQLIAYLSFFHFDENAMHISAAVDPLCRRKKIFSQLLNRARLETKPFHIQQFIIPFPAKNAVARLCLQALSGQFMHLEYRMARMTSAPESLPPTPLVFRQALPIHLPTLAQLDARCFLSDYEVMFKRFTETLSDPHREVWLAFLSDTCIGKGHLYFDEKTATLHDLCIEPTQQGQGYGDCLLKYLINHVITQKNCTALSLEVTADNASAIGLYQRNHFQVTAVFEYWRCAV